MSVCYELNSNRIPSSKIVGRNDFLCLTCTFAVIAGLLFPSSAHILDVCLIFSLSLTAALLIITVSANCASQITGLPLLIILITAMRTTLSIGAVKLIFSQGNPGTIINFFATSFLKENAVFTFLLFTISAAVCFTVIYKTARAICRLATEFVTNTAPHKKLTIQSDLDSGVINSGQAEELQQKTSTEISFFVAITGTGRFILCSAVIDIIILLVNIVILMVIGVIGQTLGLSLKTYIALSAATAILVQTSALLTAIASNYLVQRISNPENEDRFSQSEPAKKVKAVVSGINSSPSEISSFNNDANDFTSCNSQYTHSHFTDEKTPIENVEWLDEANNLTDKTGENNLSIWLHEEISNNNTYDTIAELIESKTDENVKTVILAADCSEELPVTIPVNIAVHLAKKNKKCLLIDIDLQRNSISQVFDIESEKIQTEPIKTCIDNLHVLPMQKLTKISKNNGRVLKEVLKNLENQYDHLLIYAPNTMLPAAWDKIACCSQAALFFGPDSKVVSSSIRNFSELLISCHCLILKPQEALAAIA